MASPCQRHVSGRDANRSLALGVYVCLPHPRFPFVLVHGGLRDSRATKWTEPGSLNWDAPLLGTLTLDCEQR